VGQLKIYTVQSQKIWLKYKTVFQKTSIVKANHAFKVIISNQTICVANYEII